MKIFITTGKVSIEYTKEELEWIKTLPLSMQDKIHGGLFTISEINQMVEDEW